MCSFVKSTLIILFLCLFIFSRSLQSVGSKRIEIVVDQRDVVILTLKNVQVYMVYVNAIVVKFPFFYFCLF